MSSQSPTHMDEDDIGPAPPSPTSPSVSPDRSSPASSSPASSPLHSLSTPTTANGGGDKPIFIDSDTKEALRKVVVEDIPYLLANNMNGPSFTLYHVQKHIKSRCPNLVQSAKDMGNLQEKVLSPLVADSMAGAEAAGSLVNAAAHMRAMNSKLRESLAEKGRFI